MRHEENNAGEGLDQAGDQGRDQLNRPVKGADETTWSCDGQRGYLELLEKEPENREYLKFVPKFVDLLREASEHSEHSGIRAFEHSSIYSLRCSQAQTPKCCSRALNAAKRC